MSAKRNHYTSTPLMRMDKQPKSVHQWKEAPVVLEQEAERVKRYRILQVVMSLLLPIAFIVTLILGGTSVSWGYVGASLFFLLLMWLLKAFTQSARSKLTLIYVLAAAIVVAKLIVSTPGTVTQRVVSRVDANSLFNAESALDTPNLTEVEGQTATAEETPAPEATPAPVSEAESRLIDFMESWKVGNTDAMVSLLLPSWVDEQENPKAALFPITNMNHPTDYTITRVDGGSTDDARPIQMIVSFANSDGTVTRRRYQIIMIRSNDVWFVNPNSLNPIGIVTDEDDQPLVQESSILNSATATPVPTPTVNPQLIIYYNPDGGTYYHIDPYCKSVTNRKYVPLQGQFLYEELDDARFRTLKRCRTCNAPDRLIPVN